MKTKVHPSSDFRRPTPTIHPTRGLFYGALILGALLAFEIFNYSTTDFALSDLLGNLRFFDIPWATILALAFCGIDFAGIARLFTPERQPTNGGEAGIARRFTPECGSSQSKEIWYLFGAWLLAATMNAMLTWWGVAIAILNHASLGSSILSENTLVKVVPIFVAIMVWVIRVLIIGSFSVAGSRIYSQAELSYQAPSATKVQPNLTHPIPSQADLIHVVSKPAPGSANKDLTRGEPTYTPASMSSSSQHRRNVRK